MSRDGKKGDSSPRRLSREELEELVVAVHAEELRGNDLRRKVQQECRNTAEEIECALLSPAVRRRVDAVALAATLEQTTLLVGSLLDAARAGQAWAWKVLLEATGIGPWLRATLFPPPVEEEDESFISSGFERRLVEDLRRQAAAVTRAGLDDHASGERG